jgi:cytochrome c553
MRRGSYFPQEHAVKRGPGPMLASLLWLSGASAAFAADEGFTVPAWAFPGYPDPPPPGAPLDGLVKLHVPGSGVTYARAQLEDVFAAPDWFPDRHPPMPEVVAHGRKPMVLACAYCHLPDGTGRPENAALAGLPAGYIRAQVADIRSHARQRAWKGPLRPSVLMQQVADNATDADVAAAAQYYSALPMKHKTEIVESAMVPRTREVRFVYVVDDGAGDEPLGRRLIEVPVDFERHEHRDPNVTYRAYVPIGSLERGQAIAATGAGGLTIACVTCHGADLRGTGPFPPLAGRSPSYLLRQLLAFKAGTRAGPMAAPMQPVAAKLSLDDMIAVAAYAASLEP